MRYEKGRKDSSRQKITAVASESFRRGGIAASGLAGIMKEAGLTNGAFYPHFASKDALVRESLSAALEQQLEQISGLLDAGGPSALVDAYLSVQHRDNPGIGCASAALLPEISRQPLETREIYKSQVLRIVEQLVEALPAARDREAVALAAFSMVVGALQLSRAVSDSALSERILVAGKAAALALMLPEEGRNKPVS